MFYILCGLPFAGKTTLAQALNKQFGYTIVSTDENKVQHGYSRDHYVWIPENEWQQILAEAHQAISQLLEQGQTVVFDYTNSLKSERDTCREIAKKAHSEYKILWITTSEETATKRYIANKQNKTRHDIAKDFFEKALHIFKPPIGEENVIKLNDQNSEDWIKEIFSPHPAQMQTDRPL